MISHSPINHRFFPAAIMMFGGIGLILILFAPNVAYTACTEPTVGGNYIVDTSCVFSGTANVHGVDNGGITVNTGVDLTVATGQTIVWSPGQSIVITAGGSIALSGTAQLRQTRIWMEDADADGYVKALTQFGRYGSRGLPSPYLQSKRVDG